MEQHITILGVLHIAWGALGVLVAMIVFTAVVGGGMLSCDPEAETVARADRDHDRSETLGAEGIEGYAATYLLVMTDLDPESAEMFEVAIDGVRRCPVIGDGR